MATERDFLGGVVDRDYFRHSNIGETVPLKATWIGRIERFMLQNLDCKEKAGEFGTSAEKKTVVGQLSNGLTLMSGSLTVVSLPEALEFRMFTDSLRRFWPGIGLDNTSAADGVDLAHAVTELTLDGVNTRGICDWFGAVSSMMACGDPYFVNRIIAPNSFGKEIGEIKSSNELGDKSFKVEPAGFLSLNVLGSVAQRLQMLSTSFSSELRKQTTELKNSDFQDQIGVVIAAAERSANILDYMGGGGFKEIGTLRPVSPKQLIFPIAVGLADDLERTDTKNFEKTNELRAESVVRALRRGRLALDRTGLMTMLASFLEPSELDLDSFPDGKSHVKEIVKVYAGIGLDVLSSITQTNKNRIVTEVAERLIPEVIFRLRLSDLSLFSWTEKDYKALGLPMECWRSHDKRLREKFEVLRSDIEKGMGIIPSRSVILEFSGEFNPPSSAHRAVCEDVMKIDLEMLKRSGIVDKDFDGGVAFCVNVNSGNSNKNSIPSNLRSKLFGRSIRGLSGVYLWKGEITSGLETHGRLEKHRQKLEENGIHVRQIVRVSGMDKLTSDGWYSSTREPGYEELNSKVPHVWLVQRGDMENIEDLHLRIEQVLKNYDGRCIIMVPPYCDLHSSDFRSKVPIMDEVFLGTVVHPNIIDDVRGIYK